jgi:type IV secretory pathway TrbF-like protein
MIEPKAYQDGIQITRYGSRQEATKIRDEEVTRRAEGITRIVKRDGGLIFCLVLTLLLLAASVGANMWQGMTGVITEVQVLMLDHLGQERPLVRLTDLPVTPEQTQVMGVLMNWIEWNRVIFLDAVQVKKNWDRADVFTSNAVIRQLADFRREQKYRLEEVHRRVEITQPLVLPNGSKSRSYTVEWDETARDMEGHLVPSECGKWKAFLTVADFQSDASKYARDFRLKQKDYRNILGIVVDDVSWSGRPLFLVPPPAGS